MRVYGMNVLKELDKKKKSKKYSHHVKKFVSIAVKTK